MTGEQLSASFDTLARQLTGWLQSIPQQALQRGLVALLALWIVYGIAQFVGALMPVSMPPVGEAATDTAGVDVRSNATVDIEALQALNLFGLAGSVPSADAPAQTVEVDEEALNAEKTRLNLFLEGIVYSPNPGESAAVIVHQGKQETFYVGDKVPGGPQVTLTKVLLDRVILDNGGRHEALWLYDDSQKSASAAASRAPRPPVNNRVADMRSNSSVTSMAQDYRERVFNNPSSLAQVIRITPATENGEMMGYRISPGRDNEQFKKLGLQPNDVVTRINDIALNEPSNALEVYKLMRTATEASFTIDRNGETVEIMVSLSDQ